MTVAPRGHGADAQSPSDPERSAVVTRRVLLTLGAAALTQACTQSTANWPVIAASSRSSEPEIPGDSHRSPIRTPPPTPAPISSEPWPLPRVAPPAAGHCPIIEGAVQRPGGPQHYIPCHGTSIGLTIDDGPDPTWTPQVLKLLARYRVTATFCLIGRSAAAHLGLVAAIVEGGHEVANHTWTHPLPFDRLGAGRIRDEIHRTSDLLAGLHHPPTYFRAPGGEWNARILHEVKAAGLRPLDWSIDPRDWSRPGVSHIVDTILRQTRPGAIILSHDGGGNRQQTVEALAIVLPRLIDAGYTFVTPDSPV